jgi:hypothetical protein
VAAWLSGSAAKRTTARAEMGRLRARYFARNATAAFGPISSNTVNILIAKSIRWGLNKNRSI